MYNFQKPTKFVVCIFSSWIYFWAFFWAFNEAIWFFIVPDVILTIIALYSFRRALYAVGWATFGAMVGGGVMYWIGSISSSVSQYLDRIPLISESVITRGNTLLESQMYLGAFLGSFQGIPYKIFAGIIGANWESFIELMIYTPLIRAPRFLLVIVIVYLLARLYRRLVGSDRYLLGTCIGVWILIYMAYIFALTR